MNLSAKGKLRLKQYSKTLKKLQAEVAMTKPSNRFLLNQIASMRSICKMLVKAWDATFELSLFKNSSDIFKNYNVVNGGDGSWAVALSDDNSLKLATLTQALFEDFKNNLFSYIDGLPRESKEITIYGMKLAYNNPQAIIGSAIFQIQSAIQFYNYLGTESSLKQNQSQMMNEIPNTYGEVSLNGSQINELIRRVCQIPSSYLRNSENRNEENVVTVMPNSLTGALGYHCQLALNFYLESYAVADKKDQPIILANCIQAGNVMVTLCTKLNDFIVFADRFAKEDHADYKQKIIASLKASISDQLKILATKERLECFYNQTYCDMYIASSKLGYYYDTKQEDKIPQQKQVVIAAIKKYIDELQQFVLPDDIKKLSIRLEKLVSNQKATKHDFHDLVMLNIDKDIIRENLAVTPTMVVHKLLKEVSAHNLEHVEMVKRNPHTLGETGEKINDLYSSLLTIFSQFTMAEEPYTLIKFKLIDSLICAMDKELSPVKAKTKNTVAILKQSGGSPLHNKTDVASTDKAELKLVDDLSYGSNALK